MRGTNRARVSGPGAAGYGAAQCGAAAACLLAVALVATACGSDLVSGEGGAGKSTAAVRAGRRAFDGAPPVAPHENFAISCVECHNIRGMDVPDVGFAPASPHELTEGMSAMSRCAQCHVFQQTEEEFVANEFVALRQDLRHGRRLNEMSPPVMPHKLLMRENCSACHTGPAAREEIRTSHPERVRCAQCHVPQRSRSVFAGESAPGPE